MISVDSFVREYLTTALWSETGDCRCGGCASGEVCDACGGEPLDDTYCVDDFAPDAIARATRDCVAFMSAWRSEIDELSGPGRNFGHDFWLTRNGHGAGFWDGDYPEPLGDRLTDAAHAFGECYVSEGDNGLLYLA